MYAYDLMGLHFEDERDLEKSNVERSTLIHTQRGLSAQKQTPIALIDLDHSCYWKAGIQSIDATINYILMCSKSMRPNAKHVFTAGF